MYGKHQNGSHGEPIVAFSLRFTRLSNEGTSWACYEFATHSLALQHLGRLKEAEAAMLEAHRLNRDDPGVLQALATFYAQQRRWDRAYPYAERLVRLYRNAPGPRQMLEQLEVLRKYGESESQ